MNEVYISTTLDASSSVVSVSLRGKRSIFLWKLKQNATIRVPFDVPIEEDRVLVENVAF